jgi:hypothetical protein
MLKTRRRLGDQVSDIAHTYDEEPIVVFDLPHTMTDHCDHIYSMIEKFKDDEYIFGDKYDLSSHRHSYTSLLFSSQCITEYFEQTTRIILSHVFLLPIKKISEQPSSNGDPIRHTVQWEGQLTNPPGPPWVTTETWFRV